MKPSAIRLWKHLGRKIQPPLILTQQDSSRLLNAVQASFRNHLEASPKSIELPSSPVGQHVDRILSSPHFLQDHHRMGDPGLSMVKRGPVPKLTESVNSASPLETFQQEVGAGTADVDHATVCLEHTFRICMTSPRPAEAMKDFQVGTAVYHWLWTTGYHEDLRFLDHPWLASRLVQFLVAEGRRNEVLPWITQRHCRESQWRQTLTGPDLALRLIDAEVKLGRGIAGAFDLIFEIFQRSSLGGPDKPSLRTARSMGRALYNTLLKHEDQRRADVDAYDRFSAALINFYRPDVHKYMQSRLALYHPTKPDVEISIKWAKTLLKRDLSQMQSKFLTSIASHFKHAASVLIVQQRFDEAAQLMKLLEQKFPHESGFAAEKQRAQKRKEEEDVHKAISGLFAHLGAA